MKILFVNKGSSHSEAIRQCFRGRHKITFSFEVTRNSNKGISRRMECFSSGKLSTVIRTLFAKWIWDELKSEEFELLINLPGALQQPVISASLSARAAGIPKKEIREKLMELKRFGLNVPDHQQYKSMTGQLFLVVRDFEISLRKTRKFSGYTRHHNDKGSLNSTPKELSIPSEYEVPNLFVKSEFIYNYLISVCDLSFFSGTVALTIGSNKNRNGEIINGDNL